MLNQPLAFHLEELVNTYGWVEIIHSLSKLMYGQQNLKHLTKNLEGVRDAISNILDSENFRAIAVRDKNANRPTTNPKKEN